MSARKIQKLVVSLAVVAIAGLAVGACGSSTATKPAAKASAPVTARAPAPTTTVAPAPVATTTAVGPQVLSILTTLNTCDSAQSGTTNYAALSACFKTAANQLQVLTYPANTQADAKAFVADLDRLSADALEVNTPGLNTDLAAASADSSALRHDLGLPPAS